MCCQSADTFDLPAPVIEAIAHYRRLHAERGWDWGDEQAPDFFRWARFSLFGPVLEAFGETGDWGRAVRRVVGDEPPAGVVVVRVDAAGVPHVRTGPARPAIAGHTVPVDVVVDSAAAVDLEVDVAGHRVLVAADTAAIQTVDVDGAAQAFSVTVGGHAVEVADAARTAPAFSVTVGGHAVEVADAARTGPAFTVAVGNHAVEVADAVRTAPTAELRLRAPRCSRWSVTDGTGGAWFPDGVLAKWDVHHRPFFHAHDVTLQVPADDLHVACTRGLEYDRVEHDVCPPAGEVTVVECDPPRLFDPAADGWYGGDLHVHQNYSGDLVVTPADAARMQLGEGLHLANLVAANLSTSLVYDRAMLEQYAGTDLPWTTGDAVARMGVEYRNDLLGHVHALDPHAAPSSYYAGHERSDRPDDWPPNSVACQELRGLGATVGYAHPSFTAFPGGSFEEFLRTPRSVEARELVADAALGFVDSVDLVSPFDDEGAVFLYHRLLSCGLRLAATAGTDVFLSFSHGPGVASNPPGWGRVYAHLGDQPLSVAAFKDAIRAGRTVVTNGPWLTLDVAGHAPGVVLDMAAGTALDVRVEVAGRGVEEVSVVGPDGVLATGDPSAPLDLRLPVTEPTWLAAVARGPGHPNTLDASVFAHTSAVHVDVAGERVARPADAQWCLDFLDALERFVTEHGRFTGGDRDTGLEEIGAVLEQARAYYRRVVDGR